MTLEEIKAELAAIVVSMCAKGLVKPTAKFTIDANSDFDVELYGADKGFVDCSFKWFRGDKPEDCIALAQEFIASLPNPQDAILKKYLSKLADAVDYGHSNNIPAEYVDPVRITQKTMSDNLLSASQK